MTLVSERDVLPAQPPLSKRRAAQLVRAALDGGQLRLAYQPVVQAQRPSDVWYQEALLRVIGARGKILPAASVMPALAGKPLGHEVDAAVLFAAHAVLQRDSAAVLAVNFASGALDHPAWQRAASLVMSDPAIARRLVLELTEHEPPPEGAAAANLLGGLRKAGVRLALDDFGAGHTGFARFLDDRFDLVKIDGRSVRGLAECDVRRGLVSAMVQVAHHLGIPSVAEHVERPQDARVLLDMGVSHFQGFLFGPPVMVPDWQPAPE